MRNKNHRDGNVMNMRRWVFFAVSCFMLLLAILIGPMDFFTHGYYYDEIDMAAASQALGDVASLTEGEVSVRFTPAKRHFAGFEIYMTGQAVDDAGTLRYSIEDDAGNVMEDSSLPLSSIKENTWYKVYAKAHCNQGGGISPSDACRGC